MNNLYSGKRIFYIDVLRVIAILSIILCHTSRLYGTFKYTSLKLAIPGFMNIIGLVGVPIFFMLSGALLLNRDYELGDFFKRRFSRVLYPAVFWISITVLIYAFLSPNKIYNLIFGIDQFTWFIWEIIALYLVIPIINPFINKFGMDGVKYFLLIWIFTILLDTFNMYPFRRLQLSYFAGFVGYAMLGYYLHNSEFKINKMLLAVIGAFLFVAATVLTMYLTYKSITFPHQYLNILIVLASMGVFVAFKSISTYCESSKNKLYEKIKFGKLATIIFTISACSYGMYFVNSIIRIFLDHLHIHSLKLFPLWYFIMVFGSLIVVLIVSRIPFLKKFSGMS